MFWKSKYFSNFIRSIWVFPVLCVIIVAIFTSFKVSGSSVGMYYKDLYGTATRDPNLLAGKPRDIRSDEWEFETQMISAQSAAGFPHINKNIGVGQNMAVITDVPYKDWSIIFRPQNLSFFILPLAYAFAFKWWFLAFMLAVSCYFFILILLPKKRLLSALLSLSLLLTPFVQWWYQTITLAPIFYSLLISVVTIKLLENRKIKIQIVLALLLSYLLICFALVLYPPFQIPCAIVTIIFLLGYFLEKKYYQDRKLLLRRVGLLVMSLAIFSIFTLGFLLSNKAALNAIRQSYYPGQRVASSGGYSAKHFMSSFLAAEFQLTGKANHYPVNQSEASNFILLSPFLTIAVFYFCFKSYKQKQKWDWPLIITTLVIMLFMVRLFVPHTDLLFKLLGLESVPHARLLIGVGLASFIQIILVLRHLLINKALETRWLAISIGTLAFAVNLVTGFLINKAYPGFIDSSLKIFILAAFPALIITLLLLRRFRVAAGILLIFSLISSGAVNPLYKGLGPLPNSPLISSIRKVSSSDPAGKWAVLDNLTYENIPAMAGAHSITGIYSYPQYGLWQKSPETSLQKDAYNRYAHTLVNFQNGPDTLLDLKQPDFFQIKSSPCSVFFKEQGVRHFMAEKDYSKDYSCLALRQIITFPNKPIYILDIR